MKKRLLPLLLISAFGATAQAKLPAPALDDAAKAKAAETTARAAWQAKVEGYQLCKSQDKIAARFKGLGKAGDAAVTPVVAKAASAPAPAASATVAAASAPAASASAPGTPVTAASPPAPCTDPGPFAYNAPQQKPLESSGAHSPTGTASGPPSVRAESSQMAPVKPLTAPSGGASAPAAGKKS
ncbi:hypothetical protein [Ramlibacter sp. Leaf400]|uniref:hypothetical protein n=1 Tax=Ramlibacter sp. Leaf400 TaxID=1736365 RepID=UPI0006FEB7FE|nr:hypothetical protein [Ramlibacter sp. Leaf400]KQT09694.1 hypothetical protein ASG30_14190 [Ramlibacter sp. Leaf400]